MKPRAGRVLLAALAFRTVVVPPVVWICTMAGAVMFSLAVMVCVGLTLVALRTPPTDRLRPVPMVISVGVAELAVGLPINVDAPRGDSDNVPLVVMGFEGNALSPVPAVIDVTPPDAAGSHAGIPLTRVST